MEGGGRRAKGRGHLRAEDGVVAHDGAEGVSNVELLDAHVVGKVADEGEELLLRFFVAVVAQAREEVVARLE